MGIENSGKSVGYFNRTGQKRKTDLNFRGEYYKIRKAMMRDSKQNLWYREKTAGASLPMRLPNRARSEK